MTIAAGPTQYAHARKRRTRIHAAILAWSVLAMMCLLANGLWSTSGQFAVAAQATILTTLGLIGAAVMSGDLSTRIALARLKLGPWLAMGFTLGFGVATLTWIGDTSGYHGLVVLSDLGPASTVAGLGFIALVLAYRSTPRLLRQWGASADRTLRGGGSFTRGAVGVWVLWGGAMIAWAIQFARGEFGYLSDPLAALNTTSSIGAALAVATQLGLCATVLAGWRYAADRRSASYALLLWIAGSQILIGLFSGMKEAAIVQLVAFVVGYSAFGRLRLKPIVIGGLTMLFVVSPFITAYRTDVVNNSGRLSPAEALTDVNYYELLKNSLPGNNNGANVIGDSTDRWSRIGDVAIIVAKTPSSIGYLPATELLAGPFLGLVPRSVWPGKPVLNAGYLVNQQYYGVPTSIYSSAAVTPYGDLYRHGGLPIVIIGMAVLGMFIRTVDDRRGASGEPDPRLLFLPMMLFATLVKQESDYLALSASLVSTIIAGAFASRLISRSAAQGPKEKS